MTATLGRSRALQRAIDDRMSDVWQRTLSNALPASQALRGLERLILKLRSNALYQRSIQMLKWRMAPTLFAGMFLALGLIATTVVAHRLPLAFINVHAKYCLDSEAPVTPVGSAQTAAEGVFQTTAPCWSTGLEVEKDAQYRLTLAVGETWRDGDGEPATPQGFESSEFGLLAPLAAPLRRSTTARWFQPVITVRDADGRTHTLPIDVRAEQPPGQDVAQQMYSGTFRAPESGRVFLFVNDVVLPWWPASHPRFYDNNSGTASVALQRLPHMKQP